MPFLPSDKTVCTYSVQSSCIDTQSNNTLCSLPHTGSHGPSVRINSFTLPDGLERVNGSEGEQSCGTRVPPLCIVSSDSGGTVSELTDCNFPDPEGSFWTNWAEGFFTVNRRNSSPIEIGFWLWTSVFIGEVQLSLLNCLAWGIGAPNIALYGSVSPGFPGFNVSFKLSTSTQLGSTTPPEGTSCTVQTLNISSSQEYRFLNYFLVFNYEKSPNITWLFLGEVQFFEPPPPTMTGLTSIPTPSTTHVLSSILSPNTSTVTPTAGVSLSPQQMFTNMFACDGSHSHRLHHD